MDVFSGASRAMMMTGESWARHANPLSVYSRIIGGTFVFFALWSVHWLGVAAALPIAAAAAWTVLNPRLFPPPKETNSWAARGVLGERAFLLRNVVPIPPGHRTAAMVTTVIAALFLALAGVAFVLENAVGAFAAWHGATVAKLWFCDRMAFLWDEMKAAHPAYAAWASGDWRASVETS